MVDTALTAKKLGAKHFLVVKACTARLPDRLFFYNKVKGKMEEALIAQKWGISDDCAPFVLIRPGTNAGLTSRYLPLCFAFLPGNWKSIEARDVAQAMLKRAGPVAGSGRKHHPFGKTAEIAQGEA